jgi:hypothetical protein
MLLSLVLMLIAAAMNAEQMLLLLPEMKVRLLQLLTLLNAAAVFVECYQ